MATKVLRSQVIAMCEALGYKAAKKWAKSRMQEKLVEIAELAAGDDLICEDQELDALLRMIIDNEGHVEVVVKASDLDVAQTGPVGSFESEPDDESEPADEPEPPKKKAAKKKAPAKKTAKKTPAKDAEDSPVSPPKKKAPAKAPAKKKAAAKAPAAEKAATKAKPAKAPAKTKVEPAKAPKKAREATPYGVGLDIMTAAPDMAFEDLKKQLTKRDLFSESVARTAYRVTRRVVRGLRENKLMK